MLNNRHSNIHSDTRGEFPGLHTAKPTLSVTQHINLITPHTPHLHTMAEPCRIVVMASGNGSNFQALIDAVAAGRIADSKITRLIVNRGKAYATTRADLAGIPWEYFNLISNGFQAKGEKDPQKVQESRDKYDAALAEKLLQGDYKPDLVVLAGWMYVFGKHFLDPLDAAGIKIINLHPALPGKDPAALTCVTFRLTKPKGNTMERTR